MRRGQIIFIYYIKLHIKLKSLEQKYDGKNCFEIKFLSKIMNWLEQNAEYECSLCLLNA